MQPSDTLSDTQRETFLTFDSWTLKPKVWPFIEKLLSYLFFNFPQFVILERLSILDVVLSGVKGLT